MATPETQLQRRPSLVAVFMQREYPLIDLHVGRELLTGIMPDGTRIVALARMRKGVGGEVVPAYVRRANRIIFRYKGCVHIRREYDPTLGMRSTLLFDNNGLYAIRPLEGGSSPPLFGEQARAHNPMARDDFFPYHHPPDTEVIRRLVQAERLSHALLCSKCGKKESDTAHHRLPGGIDVVGYHRFKSPVRKLDTVVAPRKTWLRSSPRWLWYESGSPHLVGRLGHKPRTSTGKICPICGRHEVCGHRSVVLAPTGDGTARAASVQTCRKCGEVRFFLNHPRCPQCGTPYPTQPSSG